MCNDETITTRPNIDTICENCRRIKSGSTKNYIKAQKLIRKNLKITINPDYKTWKEVIVSDDEKGKFIELTDYIPTKKTVKVHLEEKHIFQIYNELGKVIEEKE